MVVNPEQILINMNKRIYIAGKLSASAIDYIDNIRKMIDTAEKVRRAGYSVFVPCLDLLMGIRLEWMSYWDYFDNNIAWLEVADAMFLVPGWESSRGVKKELKIAKEKSIPIFEDVAEMNTYFGGK